MKRPWPRLRALLAALPILLFLAPALAAGPGPSLEARLDAVVHKALDEGRLVGCVVLVARNGRVVHARAYGLADREARRPMALDATFRLASMTKPLASAVVLALADRGALSLDDPVTRWLPWFTPALPDGTRPAATLRQLLTHTAGLTYGFLQPPGGAYAKAGVSDGLDRPGVTLEENLRRLASAPLAFAPGSAWGYSLSIDVLGLVAEKAGGAPLPELTARLLTGPLGMLDTGFLVADPARLATPYIRENKAVRRMADPDSMAFGASAVRFSPSRATDPAAYPSGGAGMCGTARDFLAFLEAVRLGGKGVLKPATARAMTADQLGGVRADLGKPGWGFGFGAAVLKDPGASASPARAGQWRWGGVYGHNFFMDRAAGLSVVVLTNTTPDGMDGEFPEALGRAVYGR